MVWCFSAAVFWVAVTSGAWAASNLAPRPSEPTVQAPSSTAIPPLLSPSTPPAIRDLLEPSALQAVLEDREVFKSATLRKNVYSFRVATAIRAELPRTRRVLTDYRIYSKVVPFVDRADYSPVSRILLIEGGIWKYRLRSFVQFTEVSDRWIRYRIVREHLTGLEGNFYFEPLGEKGTLVYVDGRIQGGDFPPAFVIEQGAQIVFGFTGNRMRKYVEDREDEQELNHDKQVPKPRNHL